MTWLINIIICQLLVGQSLSEWLCKDIKSGKCECKLGEIQDIEVTCHSFTATTSPLHSSIKINCDSKKPSGRRSDTDLNHVEFNRIGWEESFNRINVSDLFYTNCLKIDTGINQSISILGINEIQNIQFQSSSFGLHNKLESSFFANLGAVKKLDIWSSRKLILTNESFEGIPNVIDLKLRLNKIETIPDGVFKRLIYLEKLDLGENHITTIDSAILDGILLKTLRLDTNKIEKLSLNLPSLTVLELGNNKRLTSLNVKRLYNLKNLSLENNFNLTSMPDRPFENTSLVNFKFTNGINFTVPKEFLSNLNGLEAVILTGCNIETVPENMIFNSPNIISLSLSSNRLIELPTNFFKNSNKIKILDLSGNKIKDIDHELLKPLISLEELNLSHNLIHAIHSNCFDQLTNLIKLDLSRNNITVTNIELLKNPKLKILKLTHNKINSLLYSNDSSKQFIDYLKNLEDLDLTHNNISDIEMGTLISLVHLKKIHLKNNNIAKLKLGDLTPGIQIDLRSNPIQFISVSDMIENNYESTSVTKLSLSSDKFICDGRNYEFGRFLQNQTSWEKFDFKECDLKCDGTQYLNFQDQNLDNLTYDWNFHNGPNKINCTKCACRYRPSDASAIMDCSSRDITQAPEPEYIISSDDIDYIEVILKNNSITDWPDYTELNIRKLDLSHNNLVTINVTQLPNNLTELHLENNNLTKIAGKIAYDVAANLQNGNITMSNNLWVCDCGAMDTINFIHTFYLKIHDFKNVTCSSYSNVELLALKEERLCYRRPEHYVLVNVWIIALAVLGILFCLLLVLYKTGIKIWISNHILPLPPPDGSKIYDSFVSFSHEDEEFVIKHLVPELEGGSTPFKLCLHYRDWVVGDWIPTQIARSVDESRKTIIVLSPNFVKSVWGLLEFRTAHLSALKERKNRIIIILYGELSTKALDPELKAYLSMNTYIKWGDKWFWERLKYAIRHRPDVNKKMKTKVPETLDPLGLV